MVALGITFIVVGIGLIIGEFFTGSFLLLGLGTVSIIFALVVLATSGSPLFQVNWWVVALTLVIIFGILFFVIMRIRATYHQRVTTGKEELKGKTAKVKETLDPEGTVLYGGELWNAVSNSGTVKAGEDVTIIEVNGLMLSVIKKEPQ